jgi:oligopeptide transport system substrate-binding protein
LARRRAGRQRSGPVAPGPGRARVRVRGGGAAFRRLLVVAVVGLAGCTGGGSGSPDSPGGSNGGGAAPRGRVGGTLAIALLDPGPLDPARADDLEDEIVLGNLFDGLTAIDPAGAVRPAAAASWTSDPGLRRWEFRLRPEARWSDGAPVVAADFVYAWQRLADPRARPAPARARTLLADVTGYGAYAAGRARAIAGLQAPDPATFRVALDRPSVDLPALVAAVALSPLPAGVVRRNPAAYLARPTGNGPFRLAAPARPGRPLTLDRNPAYGAAPALLDRVNVHLVPDEQTAWLELQHGQVSFAPVPPDQLAAARSVHGPSPDGRTRPGLLQGPTLTSWQLSFNLRSTPARSARWRQAVSMAIDRQRLAATTAATAATGLVASATPGHPAIRSGPDAGGAGTGGSGGGGSCPACVHNPAKARSLVASAAPGAAPVPLAAPAGPEGRRVAELVAADLAAAGIKVTLEPAPTGGSPLTLERRVAPYPRPAASLAGQFATRGPANRSGYTNPAVDRLLDQARATPDDPARAALFGQAEAAVLADLPATPLLTEHHAAVLAPGIQGFDLTPWGTLDLATVSLPA